MEKAKRLKRQHRRWSKQAFLAGHCSVLLFREWEFGATLSQHPLEAMMSPSFSPSDCNKSKLVYTLAAAPRFMEVDASQVHVNVP